MKRIQLGTDQRLVELAIASLREYADFTGSEEHRDAANVLYADLMNSFAEF